ncbi:MAG: response regulator transcription factor [Natronohydrobacter sp.]|nr:response regulator transcription factor [Natronohydrobacter sp.]
MRVLIADDHDLLRDTLVLFLSAQSDLQVKGVGSYGEAVDAINADGPVDLLLLDYRMPGMNGLQGVKDAVQNGRARYVALMSGDAPRSIVTEALNAGAAGFLPKTLPAKSLRNAVAFMLMGEVYLPADYIQGSDSPERSEGDKLGDLSKREREVLRLLANGMSNKEIARTLNVSEAAIKLHVKTVFRHLGVANRTQAAMLARDLGVF